MRFIDQVAIVTGGAQGIGAETASMLAQEGAHVMLFDVDVDMLHETASRIQLYGRDVRIFQVDVTNQFDIRQALHEVYEEFQRIDILINSAGVLQDNLVPSMAEEEWDFVVDVNLKGSFLLAQATEQYMRARGGKMVFISSQAALGAKGRANYAAAKAGIQGLTRSLAIEFGPNNINVNAVAPGFIDTRMSEVSAQGASKRGIENFELAKEKMIAQNPIRRTGTPVDIAHAILFLASHHASYVTGQTLYVTGAP